MSNTTTTGCALTYGCGRPTTRMVEYHAMGHDDDGTVWSVHDAAPACDDCIDAADEGPDRFGDSVRILCEWRIR